MVTLDDFFQVMKTKTGNFRKMAKLKKIMKYQHSKRTLLLKTKLIIGFTKSLNWDGGGRSYKSKQARQQKMWELRGGKINHRNVDYGWFLKAFFA